MRRGEKWWIRLLIQCYCRWYQSLIRQRVLTAIWMSASWFYSCREWQGSRTRGNSADWLLDKCGTHKNQAAAEFLHADWNWWAECLTAAFFNILWSLSVIKVPWRRDEACGKNNTDTAIREALEQHAKLSLSCIVWGKMVQLENKSQVSM